MPVKTCWLVVPGSITPTKTEPLVRPVTLVRGTVVPPELTPPTPTVVAKPSLAVGK
jgi:hypothetical protein